MHLRRLCCGGSKPTHEESETEMVRLFCLDIEQGLSVMQANKPTLRNYGVTYHTHTENTVISAWPVSWLQH